MLFWLTIAIVSIGAVMLALMIGMLIARGVSIALDRRARRLAAGIAPRLAQVEAGMIPAERFAESVRARERSITRQLLLASFPTDDTRAAAALRKIYRALGHFESDLAELTNRRWWRRASAAERLGKIGDPNAFRALARAMNDDEAEVRFRAATALGALGVREAIAPLIHALEEPSRWSSIRIADILAGMGHGVEGDLMRAFSKLPPPSRPLVLDILAKANARDAAPWIRERLADALPDVRARACHALGTLGSREDGPALVARLADDAWPVRAMAAKALGRLAVGDAIPALCDALRDRQWWVRANAAESLRRLGPAGHEALERMIDDDDVYASHQAVLMLEEEGLLETRLADLVAQDDERRAHARRVLDIVLDLRQTALLEHLAHHHHAAAVRGAITDALAAWQQAAAAEAAS